jgi:ribose 5-phosphate isomerase RpiB
LVVLVHGTQLDLAPLLGALASTGIDVELQQSDCMLAATEQLAGQLVAGGALGVLLTQDAAIGLCLANRHRGVRAVLAADADTIAADAASVGANLLVVDPVRSGTFRARHMIRQFHLQGPQECPRMFEKQLK